jgi:hypothetical protein
VSVCAETLRVHPEDTTARARMAFRMDALTETGG